MKTCIAYYSKIGNTKIAAEYLAEKIGATTIELNDQTNYKGVIGFIKGGFKASTGKKTKLDNSVYDEISKYDRIILATPVWAGKTTPAINAVLENVDFKEKEVYVMTTQADPTFKDAARRKSFYKEMIEGKKGKFIDCYSLAGSSPGKPPKSTQDLKNQVDQTVKIV